jgi:hypothetical protein
MPIEEQETTTDLVGYQVLVLSFKQQMNFKDFFNFINCEGYVSSCGEDVQYIGDTVWCLS